MHTKMLDSDTGALEITLEKGRIFDISRDFRLRFKPFGSKLLEQPIIRLFVVPTRHHSWYPKCCGMCYPFYGIVHKTIPCSEWKRVAYEVAAAVFLSDFVCGSLPDDNITVNKMCR